MARIGTAFRAFFKALGDGEAAERIASALDGRPALPAAEPAQPEAKPAPRPARNDAVTFLAALQREGRLVDFLTESIDGFDDAQVGAAVRDVHRGCRSVMERMFAPVSAIDAEEGNRVNAGDHPPGFVRAVGSGGSEGTLLHPGWKASKSDIPVWTGTDGEAALLMPAEIES